MTVTIENTIYDLTITSPVEYTIQTGNLISINTVYEAGAVETVNEISPVDGNISLTQDNIPNGTTYVQTENNFTDTLLSKLNGIEEGAEVNNISDVNATDLTDGGDTTLHTHDNRYYTETETNSLLNNKQNLNNNLTSISGLTPASSLIIGDGLGAFEMITPANLATNAGYEKTANKENTTIDTSTTKYPTVNLLKSGLDLKLNLDQTSPQTITNGEPIHNTLTASELVATDSNKKLSSLAIATYPSLTELSYVKGLTSSAQTQLNGKEPILTGASEKLTIVDNDRVIILDSEATNATKYSLWSLIKSTLKTYFDSIYQATGNYFNKTNDDLDDITDGTSYVRISATNHTDLTDGGATTLHKHSYNNLDDKPTIPSSVVWYETKTWAVQGEIKVPSSGTDVLPPFEVLLSTNQTAKLVSWHGCIESGTSATFKLQKSDGAGGAFSDVTGFTSFAISGGYTNPSSSNPDDVTLSAGEVIQPVCTAVSGTPKNLSLTIVIEYTKTI